jgi:hypothetical protein
MKYFSKTCKIKHMQNFRVQHGSPASRISYLLMILWKAFRWKHKTFNTQKTNKVITPGSDVKLFQKYKI